MMAASTETISRQSLNQLIFHSLKILITPAGSSISNGDTEELIDTVLQTNLTWFQDFLSKNAQLYDNLNVKNYILIDVIGSSFQACETITVRQKITEILIVLLHCLHRNFVAENSEHRFKKETNNHSVPELPDDALSIQQEKILSTSLQFLLVLGVCPYLTPGAGIPVSQRLGPGQILLATSHDYTTELNELQRIRLILPVAKLLCDLLSVSSLQYVIVNNYLTDLITSLIFVRHCAKNIVLKLASGDTSSASDSRGIHEDKKQSNENLLVDEIVYPLTRTLLNVDLHHQPWTLLSVIQYANTNVDFIIKSSSTPLVLKSLMMLSGVGKTGNLSVKTPPWFRKIIAGLLRDVLIVPPGVQHFIFTFIGDIQSCNSSSQDWQNCKAIAQIISRCPVANKNVNPFFSSVCKQMIELIQSSHIQVQPLVVKAVGATLSEINTQRSEIVQQVCLSYLHSPLLQLTSHLGNSQPFIPNAIILSETLLTVCIETLHKIYVIGQEPHSPFCATLSPIVGILFFIFVFARHSHSNLRILCHDLIKSYFTGTDSKTGLNCFMAFALQSSQSHSCVSQNVKLVWGANGGIEAVATEGTENLQDMSSWTVPVDAAVDLLSSLNNLELISHLFIHLLEKLTEIISSETAPVDIVLPERILPAKEQTVKLNELKEKLILISFLASLGEKFGQNVIQSSQQILIFTKVTLERCIRVCYNSDEDNTKLFEWETVSMALSLLTAVLGGAIQLTDKDKLLLDEILPILTDVSQHPATDPVVKEMTEDLKIAVATRGLVWGEMTRPKQNKQKSSVREDFLNSKPAKSLIEVLSETNLDEKEKSLDKNEDNQKLISETCLRSKIEQALQDLCDPLLPVRGHGLISLSRLVEDRDPEVLTKSDFLLKVFRENLSHKDSYIYLASINGLATLSDLNPQLIIPCLTSEFRSQCTVNSGQHDVQTVLKVGESLVKATRRLGEMTPHYRDLLLNTMLVGCRHGDALVRASSLSGLSEICKLLRFAVGPVLHEVVTCCRDIINSDTDPEPRKAAVLTLTQLIQGLGRDTLKVLEDVLLDVYRTLKSSLAHDRDEKVQLNVHLALNELDAVMREVLFAKPELRKTITILGFQ